MYWWIVTVVCVCGALIVQYLCSSRLLSLKQSISIKNMALRDVRSEGERLEEQELELKASQTSLTQGVRRMRQEIRKIGPRLKDRGIDLPEPDFPLSELEEDDELSIGDI